MIQEMDLGYGDTPSKKQDYANYRPPADEPEDDTCPTKFIDMSDSPYGSPPPHTDADCPLWETSGATLDMAEGNASGMIGDVVNDGSGEDLEIYHKAERFQQLKLLSGNTVNQDIDAYVDSHYGVTGRQRLALTRHVLKMLNYRASADVLLMLSCTKRARVVIATAGAGKTTSLQVEILVDKMLDKALGLGELKPCVVEGTTVELPRILYLNYNKHNVKPIEDRHNAVCAALNRTLRDSDAVDNSLESSTVHAFCHKWLNAFAGEVELPPLEIISNEDKVSVWNAIITPRWKKFYGEADTCTVEYTLLDELYTYKVESMLDWDDFFATAKFVDSGLREDFAQSCIKKYDSMKRQMRLMDFTDYLIIMIETLREHPELKQKLQDRYRLIIADENQDFTRLMNELLLELYDPKVNRLVVVGDPDQTLYEFKGVSPDNVVNLTERLEDVQLLGLDTNYRCPDHIVDAAKKILNLNILRFEKPIDTVKTGGTIVTHPLGYNDDQSAEVIALLKKLGASEWPQTVLSYRNNQSSLIMCEELYYAGIPFRVLDDRRPFNNMVFRQLNLAIRALKEKDNFELNKALFRFLPLTREAWERILETNRLQRRNHLHDIQLNMSTQPRGTEEALRVLMHISQIVETAAVSDYFGALVRLYRVYYFDFMLRSANPRAPEQGVEMIYLDRAIRFFNRQFTWDYMQKELRERNVDNEAGVTISTFHGLKGLEFNHVIAIDFSETLFPNYASIEMKYKPNTAIAEKEAENRLCYVLVTRAIQDLHLFYPENDPSIYVSILTKDDAVTRKSEPTAELSMGSVSAPSELLTSKLDFIKRLAGDRR